VLLVWGLVGASAGQWAELVEKAHHLVTIGYVDNRRDPPQPLAPLRGWAGFWRSQVGLAAAAFPFFPERSRPDVEADRCCA